MARKKKEETDKNKYAKEIKSKDVPAKGKSKKAQKKIAAMTSTQSYSPLLGIKDGIIVTKDERYVKILELSPINFELRSPYEQDDIIAAFSGAIRIMPEKVHIKVVNTPSDVAPFIYALGDKYNEEPSAGCRELQVDQMELIYKTGQTQGVARRFFMSFEYEDSEQRIGKRPDFETIRNSLNATARSIANAMDACGNPVISSDDTDYLLDVFYNIMCKTESRGKPFEQHKNEIIERYKEKFGSDIIEAQIPINDFISPGKIDFTLSPKYVMVDGKYTTYAFLPSDAYPTRAVGGWLQVLFSVIDGIDVDFWIQKVPPEKIQRRLSFELKKNIVNEKNSDIVSENYEDIKTALQAGTYIKGALASGEDFCYISTIMTISGDTVDAMNSKYRIMKEHLLRNDMSIRQCIFQQEEAYNSTLPLADYSQGIFDKSRRNIMSSQLGSCYPFTAYELADKGGIFFGINTRYGTPVFINIFDRSKYQNANMLILGPSGSGKTYTLLSMLLRMRQQGLQIFTIAPFKGVEFARATTAVDGEFIRIAPGSNQNINIMEIRKYDSGSVMIDGEEMGTSGSILTDKIQQVERFFGLLLPDMTVQEQHILDEALIKTYAKFKITTKNKSLIDPMNPTEYRQMPVLGDLFDELKKMEEQGSNSERLLEAMARFVTGSARSFNQPTNVNLNNKFVVLDVSTMTKELLPVGMFIALDFVLDKAKANRSENKVIAIDEMWRLMSASRLTAEFAVEVFKIIRGYGGSAIGATQDLADVLHDESGAAIINNAKTKFFLPVERKEAGELAEVVDLSTEEIDQLKISKALKPGASRKILMVAGANHVFISVKTSPKEHDLITTSADDLKRIEREKAAQAAIKI